jgi:hypothetical protein
MKSRVCDKCEKPFPNQDPIGTFNFRDHKGELRTVTLRWSVDNADLCNECLNPLWKEIIWK